MAGELTEGRSQNRLTVKMVFEQYELIQFVLRSTHSLNLGEQYPHNCEYSFVKVTHTGLTCARQCQQCGWP
jgi:hypothetical protein